MRGRLPARAFTFRAGDRFAAVAQTPFGRPTVVTPLAFEARHLQGDPVGHDPGFWLAHLLQNNPQKTDPLVKGSDSAEVYANFIGGAHPPAAAFIVEGGRPMRHRRRVPAGGVQ